MTSEWTSLDVARVFEKEHHNVIKAIEGLECSEHFRGVNFNGSSYQSAQNKSMPMYDLTQDGFSFSKTGPHGTANDPFPCRF